MVKIVKGYFKSDGTSLLLTEPETFCYWTTSMPLGYKVVDQVVASVVNVFSKTEILSKLVFVVYLVRAMLHLAVRIGANL